MDQRLIANYMDAAVLAEIDEFTTNSELKEDLIYAYNLGDPSRSKTLIMFEFGKAYGLNHQILTPLAIAAELMMSAAMNSDDVIDCNTCRYGEKPLYLIKSIPTAMMVTDYMYALIFSILRKYRPTAQNSMHHGYLRAENLMNEYFLFMNEGQYRTTREFDFSAYGKFHYRKLIADKARRLFRFCTASPAYLCGRDASICEELGDFLAYAIQTKSDISDFVCAGDDPKIFDKTRLRLEDYHTGQPNLVLLHAKHQLRSSKGKDYQWLIKSWSQPSTQVDGDDDRLIEVVRKTDAIKEAMYELSELSEKFEKIIPDLPESLKWFLKELVSGICTV